MTSNPTVAVLLPGVLDSNGDAANGRVLRERLRWSGVSGARIVPISDDWSVLASPPAAIVVGTGASHDLPGARDILVAKAATLVGWHADGAEVIAVGGGWELLSEGTQTTDGFVAGVGVFPGHAVVDAERVADDVVIQTARGTVVGFENHVRRFTGVPGGAAFGTVTYGVGNGDGTDGFVGERLLASHLHGPLLAKNPSVADAILLRIAERHGFAYSAENDEARAADETARAARDVIAKRLGVML